MGKPRMAEQSGGILNLGPCVRVGTRCVGAFYQLEGCDDEVSVMDEYGI